MNITAQQTELVSLLARAAGVASQKSPLPSASRVLLEATGDAVTISAANETLSVVGAAPANVSKPGRVCVNARDMLDRIKAMPDALVTIAGDATNIKITSKGSKLRFTIHTADADDHPAARLPKTDARWVTMPGPTLAALLDGVKFSISLDVQRAHINGMLLSTDGETALAASTDGHRLTRVTAPCADPTHATILLPLAAVSEVRKIADGATVEFCADGPDAFFRAAGVTLGCRLSGSEFPPHQHMLPTARTHVAIVNRERLTRSLRAVALSGHSAEDKGYAGVKVSLAPGSVKLEANSPTAGESSDEIDVTFDGEPARFGANARYLLDWLTSVDAEQIEMSVDGELDPVVFSAGNSLGLVMPSRL